MIKSCNWCQRNEEIYLGFPVVLALGEGVEHLCGTLGMSHVGDFLNAGLFSGVVYHGWEIVLAELGP